MAPDSSFHFVAGLGSGTASAILLQPIDLLKTRVQQSGHHSVIRTFNEIRQTHHVMASLWRGTVPSAMRTGFGSAIYFTSLNYLRQHTSRVFPVAATEGNKIRPHSSSLPKLSNTANLLSGATARTFAGLVLMPLTIIKVRYESSLYNYSSITDASKDIYRQRGPRGFFSGAGATTLRDAPNAGLYVLFYEQFKKQLNLLRDRRHVHVATTTSTADERPQKGDGDHWVVPFYFSSASINFTSGLFAGISCSVVSNPFDAAKTRIQLQPQIYGNVWQTTQKLVKDEGLRALWDGLALRMTRKALSSALAWTIYEEIIGRASKAWKI